MGWRDTLDLLKDKTVDLAQAGVAQSKRLAEIAKLKTANMAEEDTIKKAYLEIGKLYYAEKGTVAEGPYAAACEKITAARAAIEVNNDRIEELKSKEDEEIEEPVVVAETTASSVVEVTEEDFVEEPAAEGASVSEEAPVVEAPAAEKPSVSEEAPAVEETAPVEEPKPEA